jgi:hypothetical protein
MVRGAYKQEVKGKGPEELSGEDEQEVTRK